MFGRSQWFKFRKSGSPRSTVSAVSIVSSDFNSTEKMLTEPAEAEIDEDAEGLILRQSYVDDESLHSVHGDSEDDSLQSVNDNDN